MRQYLLLAFASASAIALGSGAQAQTAARTAARPAEEVTLGEIVVTARRRAESLQEVPQTVNAVTSDTLQKLNIRQFQDIQTVAPGLSLQQSNTGFQNTASLRGVTFDVNTGGQIATVQRGGVPEVSLLASFSTSTSVARSPFIFQFPAISGVIF